MHPDSNTKLYCLFGRPATHSLSPAMHNAAFAHTGLNSVYLAFEPAALSGAISAMKTLPIHGASITIPFKTDVLEYIDIIDPLAARIGSVNTLHNIDGRITGYNTDGYGALLALSGGGINVNNSSILVIGNGGSARAIAFTLLNEGSKVVIAGRNQEKIDALGADLKKYFSKVEQILLNRLDMKFISTINIIINTTPVGMSPGIDECPLPEGMILPHHTVMDIVYSPLVTKLLSLAAAKGCKTISGIQMLLYQGAKQFEIWTGLKAPVSIMENALRHK